jgi:site-specific DNA-methyltransferase (adenine-specific)
MPDKSVEIVITDPPYGINIGRQGFIGRGGRQFTRKAWDVAIPSKDYFDEMRRVSRKQIIWGGNYFSHYLPSSRCWLVWWKNDGLATGCFADCELAWTSFDKVAQVFNSRWRGFVRDSREERVAHPTQKALQVMKWCVDSFTSPGDTILDPFLGSGTTAVAAKQLGRRYIGVERDPEYITIARSRLSATRS